MTPTPDRDPLESLLDAAGRTAQPTVSGWQSLPERLAETPQLRPDPLGRWGTLPIGVAAAVTIALLAAWALLHRQPLPAQELPVEVRRQSVDLTVLSVAVTERETLYMPLLDWQQTAPTREVRGQALVKDRRLVLHLKAGDNIVKFTDIAATIDPTSVRFESLTDLAGTTVVEQSFEYDLATADALLERFLDREIVCVDRSGQEFAGYLASYDADTIVLVAHDKERTGQNVSRQSLQVLRLPEMPADLIAKPTLVWKLRTQKPGKHETLLTYICGFVKWHADYVIEVTPGEAGQPDVLDINGWVTVENTSGTTYPQAGLRLIAGDVRRVKDPWAGSRALENGLGRFTKPSKSGGGTPDIQEQIMELLQNPFFEYHLYSVNKPCSIGDHQVKQLSLFKKQGVKASRRYVFEPYFDNRILFIDLAVKNEEENNLGVPLPKGRTMLQQRGQDGELAVVGQMEIDHTAAKEEFKLFYGHAFDVVGEQREALVEKIDKGNRITYETRIRNHKPTPIAVRSYADLLDGELQQASMPHVVENSRLIYFDFTLPANEEQVIRYTVVYRSEK
jgi:hypothetical protein